MTCPDPAPRNRQRFRLPGDDVRIRDAERTHIHSPGSLDQAFSLGEHLNWKPHLTSVLSGHPAILYAEDDFQVALTPEEARRLWLRALTPGEVFALRSRFGNAPAWGTNVYDPATGTALSPLADIPQRLPPTNPKSWPKPPEPGLKASTQRQWLWEHPAIISGELSLKGGPGILATASDKAIAKTVEAVLKNRRRAG